MSSTIQYHLQELEIAKNKSDPGYVMPGFAEADHRILDIGCGIGQTFIAANLRDSKFLVGIDIDFESLLYGKKSFKNIMFTSGTGDCLPFKDNSFDLVISRVSLSFTNVPQSIGEISRVLKNNGRIWLVLCSFSLTVRYLIKSVFHLNIKEIIIFSYALLNGIALHFFEIQFQFPFIYKKYNSFQTKSRMIKLLKFYGFKKINIKKRKHFVVTAIK